MEIIYIAEGFNSDNSFEMEKYTKDFPDTFISKIKRRIELLLIKINL